MSTDGPLTPELTDCYLQGSAQDGEISLLSFSFNTADKLCFDSSRAGQEQQSVDVKAGQTLGLFLHFKVVN